MTIEAGTHFGPYEIGPRIGAGGMGEVYRARDTRLDRSVAIKVLPAEFANDAQLRLRFEREAKTISQLEHPNICRLYDVGDGYLVMELLDGESLADRLSRGPLPLRDVLKFGAQIAEGLHRAHRHGIIHRDLKPGNIMLTKSGAKLLDFGLARPVAIKHDVKTEAVTAQAPLTGEAVVLGTCAYMSPEQVRAEEIDARSDIFSLGIVLYEMLSGRRPFTGGSAIEMMHAIAQTDPPFLGNDGTVPPAVAQVVHRCLEKDRDDRFQSAGDVAFALTNAMTPSSGSAAAPEIVTPSRRRSWLIAAALLVIVGASAALLTPRIRRLMQDRRVARFEIGFPADSPLIIDSVAISPDGRTLAYVRARAGIRRVYLRPLDSLEDAVVEGSDGATMPFFSPDGRSLAFGAGGKLKKVRLDNPQVVTISDSGTLAGGTWTAKGTIIYSSANPGTLFEVPENGGDRRELAKLDSARHERLHCSPQLLPDNHTLLFLSVAGFGTDEIGRIEALDLTTGKRRVIVSDENDLSRDIQIFSWSDGVLLFARMGRLYAARFDPNRDSKAGNPSVVLEPFGDRPFGISADGTLAYFANGSTVVANQFISRLMRVTSGGAEQRVPIADGIYSFLSLSPDERQLAVTQNIDNRPKIAIVDLARGTVSLLVPQGSGHIPVWTPDSARVVYSWTAGGPSTLMWRRADGSDDASPLTRSSDHQDPGSFSPDGRWFMYSDRDPNTSWDIWLMSMTDRTTRPYLRTQAAEFSPMISPDGRRIAYVVAAVDGQPQVFIDSFPQPSHRVYVGDGRDPLWSRDGRTLYFYQNPRILAALVSDDGSIAQTQTAVADYVESGTGFGVAPFASLKDGSLLLFRPTTTPSLVVVLHWTTELEKLMKGDRSR